MNKLLFNFSFNLTEGSTSKREIFKTSLKEQFEKIKPLLKIEMELEAFLNYLLRPVKQDYYISLPSFVRKMEEDTKGNKKIYNVVIRPAKNKLINEIISKKYDILLIGDIKFTKRTNLDIKGIEIIDSSIKKFGERRVTAAASFALTLNSYGHPDYKSWDALRDYPECLTIDFVDDLCQNVKPVSNYDEVEETFAKWHKYLDFRYYYIKQQEQKSIDIDYVEACDSYSITKGEYRLNEDEYKDYVLDDLKKFCSGDQVIIDRQVGNAQPYPLIKIVIDKNRKEITEDSKNQKKCKFFNTLSRFTRDQVFLSNMANENKEKLYGYSKYPVGERYLITSIDKEPVDELALLDSKYQLMIEAKQREIDKKYDNVIATTLKKAVNEKNNELSIEYQNKLDIYIADLNSKLESDIEKNEDISIRNKIDSDRSKIKNEYDRQIKALNNKIDQLTRNKNNKKSSNKNKADKLSVNQIDLKAEINKIEKKKTAELDKINFRDYYIERNNNLVKREQQKYYITQQNLLNEFEKQKNKELRKEYDNPRNTEKDQINVDLSKELEGKKILAIENDTIREFLVYFRPNYDNDTYEMISKDFNKTVYSKINYDSIAEIAKIDRQKEALESLERGNIINPYLSSYLFNPKELTGGTEIESEDISWFKDGLNSSQKEAVRKALVSNSIFLLQGPPGTGKTEVIAELTAQYVKRGKKVLISSETHKAIDNVFDRLAKTAEIRPIRLISAMSGKETQYSPERLVDNLYLNISENLKNQVRRFENFKKDSETFEEDKEKLQEVYNEYLRYKSSAAKVKTRKLDTERKVNELYDKIAKYKEEQKIYNNKLEDLEIAKRLVNRLSLDSPDLLSDISSLAKDKIDEVKSSFVEFKDINYETISKLLALDNSLIEQEINVIKDSSSISNVKEIEQIKSKLFEYMTIDPQDESIEKEIKELRTKLIELKNAPSIDENKIKSTAIYEIMPNIATFDMNNFVNDIKLFKIRIEQCIGDVISYIEELSFKEKRPIDKIEEQINNERLAINKLKEDIEECDNDETYNKYESCDTLLKQSITAFFNKFTIVKEYSNYDEAFEIINEEWTNLNKEYTDGNNTNKIGLYKEIYKYLSNGVLLDDDKAVYTKELYECANVFGMTCTSRDNFDTRQIAELSHYGIDKIDMKAQGIDVVIIDEVSKSSFLDLLIPMLYGKTVILVGDHRQLPPMYDLRHLNDDEMEDLDHSIINKEINKEYTKLYETSFFKELFENINPEFKIMLNRQYRCHSHIMSVFNHFYGGDKNGLKIGTKDQDNRKEHYLSVGINDNIIIDPKKHVYFVDCEKFESSRDESTSKQNEQEKDVAVKLLKELNEAAKASFKKGYYNSDYINKDDKRLSAGVICTYGDQARLILNACRKIKFDGFNHDPEEKFIISTVDDFQGDERDIIIVSMVRNPKGKSYDPEFINKFERINVALSRARKLLIVLGSRSFLERAGVIELPDLSGDKSKDKHGYHVYREIINTINTYGRVLTANMIIGDEE